MAFDMGKYISTPGRVQGPNLIEGARVLAKINSDKARLDENARQFDQSQSNQMQRHEVNSGIQQQQTDDAQSRFKLKLKDTKIAREREYSEDEKKEVQKAVFTQGQLVAAGKYREAMGMAPGLKAMGVDVQTTANEDGTFQFNVTAPTFGDREGDIDDPDRGVQPRLPPVQPQQQPVQPQGGSATPDQTNRLQALMRRDSGLGQTIPSQLPQRPMGTQLNPGSINTGVLEGITRRKLAPILGGVIGSYPAQFQNRIGTLSKGFSDSGVPAAQALEMMKAPQAQATSLMKSEMGARAAGIRARATEGGRDFSEEFRREDKAYQNMHRDAKENGVKEAMLVVQDVDRIKADLESKNGVKVYAALKDLMLMKEKRLTDKDMEGGTYGLISNMDKLKEVGVRVAKTASPEMVRKWKSWADSVGDVQKKKVAIGMDALVSQTGEYKYESGRSGAERFLGELPQNYVLEAVERYNKTRTQRNVGKTPTSSSQHSSASVSIPGSTVPKSQAEEYSEFF